MGKRKSKDKKLTKRRMETVNAREIGQSCLVYGGGEGSRYGPITVRLTTNRKNFKTNLSTTGILRGWTATLMPRGWKVLYKTDEPL